MKAQTLTEAIAIFNPREPLMGDRLVEFYVDRAGNPMESMKMYLLGLRSQPVKLLFSGHRGSGKTTELNRLAETIKRQFFIVPINLSPLAGTLTYQDILMGMVLSLYRRAAEKEAIIQSPVSAIQNAWEASADYFRQKMFGQLFPGTLPDISEVKVKLGVWVGEVEARYNLAISAREQFARYIDTHLDELHDQINQIAGLVQTQVKRPPLFIVEGIDKADLSRARVIFRDYTNALTAFRAAAIYTFPIGLAYATEFSQIRIAFEKNFTLPNLNLTHRNGQSDPQGQANLREIVLKRLEKTRIEEDALSTIIQASGGLVTLLIRLVQNAAVKAISQGEQVITPRHALAAIVDERNDFVRLLRPQDYPVLAARHTDKVLSADPTVQELLHSLALLEYANADFWCDVNPVILPLLAERVP